MRRITLLAVTMMLLTWAGLSPAAGQSPDASPRAAPLAAGPWRVTDDPDLRGLDTVLALGRDGAGLVLVAGSTMGDKEGLVVLASGDGMGWHVRSRRRMRLAEAGPFVIDGRRIVGFGPGLDQPLLLSDDGGRTWRVGPDARPLMPGIRAQQDCCPWHFPYGSGLAMVRTRQGWLLAGSIWPRFESRGRAALWTSTTGARWRRLPAPRAGTLLAMATDGGTAVVIADGPGRFERTLWWRSRSGRWSPATTDLGAQFVRDVLAVPGHGYLAWAEGDLASVVVNDVISLPVHGTTFLTSPDGRAWTRRPAASDLPDTYFTEVSMVADRRIGVGSDEWDMPAVWEMAPDETWRMEELPVSDPTGADEIWVDTIAELDGRVILAGSECSSGRCRIDVWVEP